MKPRQKHPPLQVLTIDRPHLPHERQAAIACRAGARWIQFRAKRLPLAKWIATAAEIVEICRDHGAVCIVNDSVWVALAADADGVHLGALDHSPEDARRLLGPDKIIGVTVNSPADADRVARDRIANYAGVGPWRRTRTKKNLAPVLSPEEFRIIFRTLAPMPAAAIGGMTVSDVPAILALGAHGVAVSSAVFDAEDPFEETRLFLRRIASVGI